MNDGLPLKNYDCLPSDGVPITNGDLPTISDGLSSKNGILDIRLSFPHSIPGAFTTDRYPGTTN